MTTTKQSVKKKKADKVLGTDKKPAGKVVSVVPKEKVVAKVSAEEEVETGYYAKVRELKKKWRKQEKKSKGWKIGLGVLKCLLLSAWVAIALFGSQYLVMGALIILNRVFGIQFVDNATFETILSAVIYVVCLAVTIFLPWLVLKEKTTRDELGLRGLLTWTDIGLALVGFVLSLIIAFVITAIMQWLLPFVDWEQKQEVGYENISGTTDMLMAFIALVVIAPIAEEIVFRGWLYGKLRLRISAWPAILLVSVLFGVVHLQVNVAVSVASMSLVMCLIREYTGTIWGGMLVHMFKNGLAYYLLFVHGIA